MPGTEVFSYVSKLLATNVWLPDAVADLATEFSPLPQTKIGKKDEQLTEKQQFRVTAVISWLSTEIFPLGKTFLDRRTFFFRKTI